MAYIVVTSDVHLSANNTEINDFFIKTLKTLPPSTQHLYILGDLFEAWTDTEYSEPWLQPILHALKRQTQKHPITLLLGNHDFLISDQFKQLTHVNIQRTETLCIQTQCDTILLMHGDQLATYDPAYQRLRRILRQPWLQKQYQKLPTSLKHAIAHYLKQASNRANQSKPPKMHQPSNNAIDQIHTQHPKTTLLIFGHFHRPQLKAIKQETSIGQLNINILADWVSFHQHHRQSDAMPYHRIKV